ncbi:MAG: hypothetical protein PF518_07805, partial [Spirochaetaceae bacterium]|nr:hypothetical protein [Spirochaetaceae bacterium]
QIKALAKLESVNIDSDYVAGSTDASAVMTDLEIFMPLEGLIDFEVERGRLEKEIAKIDGELKRVDGKLSNEKFMSKAPQDIVDKERSKKEEFEDQLEKLRAGLSKLG